MMNFLPQWSRTALCCLLLIGGLPLLAQPANDLCGDAVLIALDVPTDGTTVESTQTDAPTCDSGSSVGRGVWYTFAGTGDQVVITVDLVGWDAEINVSSGTCDDLTNIICRDSGNPETATIDTEVGTNYFVYVADWITGETRTNDGEFTITISAPPAPAPVPANDECDAAVALTVNADLDCAVFTSGSTESATESAQGNGTCGGTADDDVWYSFVATSESHTIELSNASATFGTTSTDLYHIVWSGTCDAPVQVQCSDPNTSSLSGLTVGDTYLVQVYSWSATGSIAFDICVGTPPPPPANDECDAAVAVTVNDDFECGTTTPGTITSATQSPQGNGTCGGTEDDDVWFSFVATNEAHRITLGDIDGSTTDLYHVVWSGTCDAPVQVNCSDPNTSNLTGLTVGETYLIQVYTWTATAGQTVDFTVCIGTPPPPPANDDCVDAIELNVEFEGFTSPDTFDNISDTPSDLPAPTCGGTFGDGADVFFTVTPTSDTLIVEVADGGDGSNDFAMTAYSGPCDDATQIECDDDDGPGSFPRLELGGLTPGEPILLRVYEFGQNGDGAFTISAFEPAPAAIVLDCPTLDTIFVNSDCSATIEDITGDVTADDDEATFTQDSVAGTMLAFDPAVPTAFDVTVTAVSPNNPAPSTCVVSVEIIDTIAPILVCRDVTVDLDDMGNSTLDSMMLADSVFVEVVENCAGEVLVAQDGDLSISCASNGTARITLIGTDASGNVGTCIQTITVLDTSEFCLGELVLECGEPTDSIAVGDDCMVALEDYTGTVMTNANNITQEPAAGEMVGLGDTTILVIATIGDQIDTCTILVNVADTTAPTAVCADLVITLDDDGNAAVADSAAALGAGSTDNCTVDALTFATDVMTLTCAEAGDSTVTVTVTDESGNSSTCTSVITIADSIAPVITVTTPTITLSDDGEDEVDVTEFATATDNCDPAPVLTANRSLTFGCGDIGAQTVVITATDASGNTSTDSVEVIVLFEQPDLACIARLNVTLNDDCAFIVEPSQVLRGNTNCLDAFGFDIIVMDGDTSNGPIVDGCGTYDYMIRSTASPTMTATGFVGDYAEEFWTIEEGANSSVEFTEETITLLSPGDVTMGGTDDDPSVSYQFMETATVTMTIDYSLESEILPDVLVVDFNGNVVFESVDAGTDDPDTGSEDFELEVEPGNTLIIGIEGDGFVTGGVQSVVTVSDFTVTTANLLGLDFETCWGTITAEDKTPIELEETPDDILSGLLCADVDANNINTLPASVSKCFLVDNEGEIIAGSMDAELMSILSPDMFDDVEPDTALIPTFTDGCASTIEVCVSDVVASSPDGCGQTIITRTFRANEADGCAPLNPDEEGADEEVVTSFTISFDRPTLDSLNANNIQPVVEIEACGSATSPLEFLPGEDDYPFLQLGERTFSLASNEAACSMIATTFENSPNIIQTCANTVKFQRTYTVVDWCNPTEVQTFSQFVKIGDTTGPTFSAPSATVDNDGNLDATLTYRTNVGGECAAMVRLDGPGVGAVDECAGEITMSVAIYPEGDLTRAPFGAYPVIMDNGAPEMSDPLEVGDYAFVYTSTDVCGNQTVSTVPFQVVDGNGPAAFCEDGLNIGLSRPAGLAVVTPDQIDKGSSDDCSSELTYQVGVSADMTSIPTEFSDEVVFTCDDLGTQFVTLEVTDEEENVNYCWTTVLVELKVGDTPTCIAPSAVTLTCSEFTTALPGNLEEATDEELNAAFGVATGVGTCGAEVTGEFIVNNLNECGIGTAVREYQATDPQGGVSQNTCTQLITIVGIYDYQIVLPGNARTNDCMDEFEADELEIVGGACDLPVVTPVTEEIFNTAGEECYQIRTTYTIVNTCEFDPATGGTTVISRDGLDVSDSDPIYLNVVSRNAATEGDDLAFVSGSDNLQFTPNDDDDLELVGYAASAGRGNFTYVQNINVFDRTSPVVEAAAPTACIPGCTADLSLPFTATDECLAPRIQLELDPNFTGTFEAATVDGVVITLDAADADNGNYVINATGVPAGDHAIRITAIDGCGNATPVIVQVSVCGDVAPVPLCIQTLVATLQMNEDSTMAMAEVWATDFLTNSALVDCFGDEVTKYGIVRAGEGPATEDQIGAKVFCDDMGELVPFEVYAFSDNVSDDVPAAFCSVLVQVAEGEGVECGMGGNLAGTVITASSLTMADVEVTLTGSNDMDEMQLTGTDGTFNFTDLMIGGDYTLTPAYQEAVNLQEVKISDVVMISSVILGAADFDSRYDYLAADVNQDMTLNVLDMVAIQRVILGLDDIYRTGESWGFVPANVDVSNPYAVAFPEVINTNNFDANILNADFVAFAYGNVTGEGRTAMTVEVADAALAAGETHTLTIDAADLAGFQGTIELAAGLELVAADYAGEGALNLNYAAQGQIAVALLGGTVTLEVRATEAGKLSDLVTLTDAIAVREGVAANGASGAINLTFGATVAGEVVTMLGEATPNPVVESTMINYTLAADSDVTLSIQDVQGRTILVRNLRGTAGVNGELINVADLNGATGVLTYTLVAGDFSATKKMVVVR
ncbi:T9SS type A sorting domain-containing protein [Lewinella sp. 4G2]|uniref:T9SS type A sorting domain-containing protein n=1 Tax=Lewinella sp. 4G2 TaxID=1803372 RepID=UPI0007B46D7E|nr:T9SS type A sorting domain-containing protein [Lewinella sp. 4G2]OAV44828.1 hypothetical protein A3850_010150 [Lewinella sp. 4G2]